ncbi:MAG: hypothetical protein COB66_00460 [Coxiella sp. (in: Bacteria)]|nr:MAG: hypothetical protein COB66_00460 [Coxiella sp. (in: g-proteobacteria)]
MVIVNKRENEDSPEAVSVEKPVHVKGLVTDEVMLGQLWAAIESKKDALSLVRDEKGAVSLSYVTPSS